MLFVGHSLTASRTAVAAFAIKWDVKWTKGSGLDI